MQKFDKFFNFIKSDKSEKKDDMTLEYQDILDVQKKTEDLMEKHDPEQYKFFKSAQENGRLIERSRIMTEIKKMIDGEEISYSIGKKLLKLFND